MKRFDCQILVRSCHRQWHREQATEEELIVEQAEEMLVE